MKESKARDKDFEIVQKAKKGDFAAFEKLVIKYERLIYSSVVRLTQNHQDAEDVVQKTFLSVIDSIKNFREESSFYTWLMRIAINHALKILRKKKGLPTVPYQSQDEADGYNSIPHPEFIAPWREQPDKIIEKKETRRVLTEALGELDDKYRLVFILRDIHGLSTEETAKRLKITLTNAKVRLLRARLMLRERLTQVFGDEKARVFPGHEHQP